MIRGSVTSFIADTAIPAGARVKLVENSGVRVALAGADDAEIGTAILHSGKSSYAANTEVGVKLVYGDGTRSVIAAGPVSAGAVVYKAAGGKVAATGTNKFGVALEAASADGDIIEVLYAPV